MEWKVIDLSHSLVGWLVGWTTHSSSRGPQAQPPPADLRVSSGNVIAALPASFWWPSRAQTGTREEGLKIANRDWAPTYSQAQAKQGHTQDTNRLQSARWKNQTHARKHHWDCAPQSWATPCHYRQGEIRSPLSGQLLQNDRPLSEVMLTNGSTPTAQSNGSRPATRGDYSSTKHHFRKD